MLPEPPPLSDDCIYTLLAAFTVLIPISLCIVVKIAKLKSHNATLVGRIVALETVLQEVATKTRVERLATELKQSVEEVQDHIREMRDYDLDEKEIIMEGIAGIRIDIRRIEGAAQKNIGNMGNMGNILGGNKVRSQRCDVRRILGKGLEDTEKGMIKEAKPEDGFGGGVDGTTVRGGNQREEAALQELQVINMGLHYRRRHSFGI